MRRVRSLIIAIVIVVIALWVVTPMARAMLLLREDQHPIGSPPVIAGIRAEESYFYTSNDATNYSASTTNNPIPISGWLCVTKSSAPTVIVLPGWKDDRSSMLKYAAFLLRDKLNVLLIDFRGSGHSGGEFSLGLNEPMDVKAAVSYLDTLTQITNHHYGVLGVSFGAGVAIAAAGGNGKAYAGETQLDAIVSDSPWATEDPTIDRLDQLQVLGRSISFPNSVTLFGRQITFLPDARWAIDATLGGTPDTRSALAGAQNLTANQALLIIHSVNDSNATTTEADARALFDAAKVKHKFLWMAPMGDHAGAYDGQPAVYEAKVLDFFQKYLVSVKDPPVPHVYPGNSVPGRYGH
jgi:pimeloyl-ACP methyl ester carboxylesterase